MKNFAINMIGMVIFRSCITMQAKKTAYPQKKVLSKEAGTFDGFSLRRKNGMVRPERFELPTYRSAGIVA
jgi:hypothetical protein